METKRSAGGQTVDLRSVTLQPHEKAERKIGCMVSEIERLKAEEQEAWRELVSYIDFTDKCKKRVYKGQKDYAPVPVPEVEAEFTRRIRRWDKAQLRLREFEDTLKYRASSETQRGADESPRRRTRPQPPA